MINWTWGKRALTLAAIAGATAVFATANTARAGVLVNDTWIDGTDSDPAAPVYSENGVDADGDGNIESAWFQGGTGTLDPVGPNGPLRGDLTAGGGSSGSWTTYFTPESSPVTLAQGEKLKVTWQFSLSNIGADNTSQNFRVALVDSPAGTRLVENGSPGAGAYTGYSIFGNLNGGTLGNSSPFQLRERVTGATGNFLSSSSEWVGVGNGATNGNTGYAADTPFTMTWELERTLADELVVNVSMAGGNLDGDGLASVSYTDATPSGFTYDTFGIRPSSATGTAQIFDTSLFSVEHVAVPEPSSLALLGFAGLAALRRRRTARA